MPFWFATRSRARPWWAPGGPKSSLPARCSRWSTTSSSASTCWVPVTDPRDPAPSIPKQAKSTGRIFPWFRVRDNVRAQARLLDSLGIRRLRLVLGGSIGGMQALEWTILHPERVERALIIGVTPLSAMGLALNHLQRQAIQHDPEWAGGRYLPQRPPRRGLALARQIAMISYKSAPLFDERFGRNPNRSGEDPWAADGKLRRPDRRTVRHCRLPRSPGRAIHRALRRQCLPGHPARHGHLGSAARLRLAAGGIRPHSRPAELYRHQLRLAFPRRGGSPICRDHSRRRASRPITAR